MNIPNGQRVVVGSSEHGGRDLSAHTRIKKGSIVATFSFLRRVPASELDAVLASGLHALDVGRGEFGVLAPPSFEHFGCLVDSVTPGQRTTNCEIRYQRGAGVMSASIVARRNIPAGALLLTSYHSMRHSRKMAGERERAAADDAAATAALAAAGAFARCGGCHKRVRAATFSQHSNLCAWRLKHAAS